MRQILIVLIIALSLTACASAPSNEASFYDAQRAWAERVQMPLVELTAQPGQDITGLQSLRVYAPPGGGQAQVVQQYRAPQHPAWGIAADALRIGLPIYLGGRAAVDLADTVGRRVGEVARDVTVVEPPAPVIVPGPDPVIVEQPAPIIVDPVIVQPEAQGE